MRGFENEMSQLKVNALWDAKGAATATAFPNVDSVWLSAYDSGAMVQEKKSSAASTLQVVLSTIGVILTIVVAVVACTVWISSKFSDVGTRIGKVEASVKVLASQQSDKTKDLIKELLSEATSNAVKGDSDVAIKAAKAASVFVNVAKRNRNMASPDFFQNSVAALNAAALHAAPQSELSDELLKTRIAIAEYRSALEPSPANGATLDFRPVRPGESASIISAAPSGFSNINFLLEGDTTSAIRLAPPLTGKLAEGIFFENGVIKGGTQTLDGIHWRNAVFIDTHIRYGGGEVELQNVRFVNCTFEVPQNTRGIQVADYAALAAPYLTIG